MEIWFTMIKLCYYGKTMVLWKKDTMEEIIVLYQNIMELRMQKEKNMLDYYKLWFLMEKTVNIPKQLKFLNKYIALEL